MKYLYLHLLLSVALIGQVNGMTNKMSPRTIKTPKPTPKIEVPATNGMNANDMNNDIDNIDNNDDDDYTVEAEFMTDTQTNGGNGSAMQLETEEATNGVDAYGAMQNGKEAAGAYGTIQDFESETVSANDAEAVSATEMTDTLTDVDADTQATQNNIASAKNTRK